MALLMTDLVHVSRIVKKLGKDVGTVNVLSLGYPDLLLTRDQLNEVLEGSESTHIPVREDSEQVAKNHGKEMLRQGVFESRAVFEALGGILTVIDSKSWTGCELLHNLNDPLPDQYKDAFHLIIDPGTLEHVFNVAEAIKSISKMVKVGGYVYHHNPFFFLNHGFYNFSPIFYMDYYENNGFEIEQMAYVSRYLDEYKLRGELNIIDEATSTIDTKHPVISSIIVRKVQAVDLVWPTQRKHGKTIRPWYPANIVAFEKNEKNTIKEDIYDLKVECPHCSTIAIYRNEHLECNKIYDLGCRRLCDYCNREFDLLPIEYYERISVFSKSKTIAIYGAGITGSCLYEYCVKKDKEILFFIDDFKEGQWCNLDIIKPDAIEKYPLPDITIFAVGTSDFLTQIIPKMQKLEKENTFLYSTLHFSLLEKAGIDKSDAMLAYHFFECLDYRIKEL